MGSWANAGVMMSTRSEPLTASSALEVMTLHSIGHKPSNGDIQAEGGGRDEGFMAATATKLRRPSVSG